MKICKSIETKSIKSNAAEAKLEKLKALLDREIISKEEYEKKKSELF